jgi:hypothetical protein
MISAFVQALPRREWALLCVSVSAALAALWLFSVALGGTHGLIAETRTHSAIL